MLKVSDEQFDEYATRLLNFAKSEHIDGKKLIPSFLHLKTQANGNIQRLSKILEIFLEFRKNHKGALLEM